MHMKMYVSCMRTTMHVEKRLHCIYLWQGQTSGGYSVAN